MKNKVLIKGIFLMLFFSIIISNVLAVTCECNTCSDCATDLQNTSCDYVKLTADITDNAGNCIVVSSNNTIFDCQSYTIDGTGSGYGVRLQNGAHDTTVKNCIIEEFDYGFLIYNGSHHNTIRDSTAFNNGDYGFVISLNAYSNKIINVNASNSSTYVGIYVKNSNGVTISYSVSNNNGEEGIYLWNSNSSAVIHNTASNNAYDGIRLQWSKYVSVTNNYMNDNAFYGLVLMNESNDNKIIRNFMHSNTKYGIYSWNSVNNDISENDIRFNGFAGIYLYNFSNNNIISDNEIYRNERHGIYIGESSNNIISDNIVNWNEWTGIYLLNISSNNTLNDNYFCINNRTGGDYPDIVNKNETNKGDNNYCDYISNWNDTGAVGCSHSCSMYSIVCPTALSDFDEDFSFAVTKEYDTGIITYQFTTSDKYMCSPKIDFYTVAYDENNNQIGIYSHNWSMADCYFRYEFRSIFHKFLPFVEKRAGLLGGCYNISSSQYAAQHHYDSHTEMYASQYDECADYDVFTNYHFYKCECGILGLDNCWCTYYAGYVYTYVDEGNASISMYYDNDTNTTRINVTFPDSESGIEKSGKCVWYFENGTVIEETDAVEIDGGWKCLLDEDIDYENGTGDMFLDFTSYSGSGQPIGTYTIPFPYDYSTDENELILRDKNVTAQTQTDEEQVGVIEGKTAAAPVSIEDSLTRLINSLIDILPTIIIIIIILGGIILFMKFFKSVEGITK